MVGGDIVKIIVMENLTGYKEEVNMSASVERGRKRTNIILIIGVILLFAIRCMDFYGVEGVSVYSGLVSVEKYWLVFAVSVAVMLVTVCVKAINITVSLVLRILCLLSMFMCDLACMYSADFAFAMSSVCVGFAIYTAATIVIIVVCIISDSKK